jgi:transglutaminase-like putative cysteine protease
MRSPVQGSPSPASAALAVTAYCDHDHPSIKHALAGLSHGAADERAIAQAAFRFVRDEVPYTLGPWGVAASETLRERAGMCTNKANLLVALLRSAAIPAAYGVLRVNAREYFGVVGPQFLTRFVAAESTHVYAAAYLEGRWVRCDPSTDRALASRTAHFCRQTQLVEWDGRRDALDFLDPDHIYADLGLFADVDELLAKPSRGATPARFELWNDYLEHIRRHPAYASSEALIASYHGLPSTQRLLERARARRWRRPRDPTPN